MFSHFLLVLCVEQTDKLENILLPLGIYTHYEYNLCLLIFFVFTKTCLKKISYILTNKRVRAILESSSKRGSFDRISSCQEFGNFENLKWEKISFVFFVSWKKVKNPPSTSFRKLWVGGQWVVSCDYSVSSAPLVSELRL